MCHGKDISGSVGITQGREVLPGNVKPTNYTVELEPNFETFKYDGTVVIDLEVVEKSTTVTVNLVDIDIKEVYVEYNGSLHSPTDSNHNEETQTVTWTFKKTIPEGTQGNLTIKFQGSLNDNMAGFYRSSYKDEEENTKYMAATQMQPADARRDVESDIGKWTKKIGYPVITVEEHGNTIRLTQNRYLRTADVKPEEDETLWPIFLGLRTSSGVSENLTFKTRETLINLDDSDFYKLNANHTGVYRTLYPPDRLTKLVQAAHLLSTEDRAGLVGDAGALATSGHQNTSSLLDLLLGLKNEKEYIVLSEIASTIGSLEAAWLFEPKEILKSFQKFQKDLFAPLAHEIGWNFKPGDSDILQQLKALTFGMAGYGGDEEVVAAAKEMFKKLADGDLDAINPNIRSRVYHIVLQHSDNDGEKEWDIIRNVYLNGRASDERNVALQCLSGSKNAINIHKTLDMCFNGEVKEQDICRPISGLGSHAAGAEALWAWIQRNWDTLEATADIERFFKDKSRKGFDKKLAQSLDGIRAKAAWVKRDADDVKAWLKANGYIPAEKF
ncbi:ERAP1-like C-terminal domain-domain-containing protein [Tuber borchii]|uniref:ERAP1-like C-terminal domain-domain-containing protein n=1 Tax=Tuber borchii TaxID=42251 RepID=A0A2T6ZH80_TUBBO|nr:ERAP1-like C-terminal domain-domain-containing protein [Tuber borchii]